MDINLKGPMPGMPSLPPQLPVLLFVLGAGAIGFGVLILYNEQLLRWLVAGLFVLVGLLLFGVGLRAKRMLG